MLTTFVDLADATFRFSEDQTHSKPSESTLLKSMVYRPALFRRNGIRWISTYTWRARSKARGLSALKEAKKVVDPAVLTVAATSVATLIHEIFGDKPVEAITCVPCGHSRRPDCFSKRLAQSVATACGLPFLQIFADRPCAGTSHPKQSLSLPPLEQIADPPRSMILVDDIVTSGVHVQESMLALRHLGAVVSTVVWISGATRSGIPLSEATAELATNRRQRPAPFLRWPAPWPSADQLGW
jgi:hypothetical protein